MQDDLDNPPLDLSYLTEMVGEDPEFIIEVFNTFIDQSSFYLNEMEKALQVEDWVMMSDCAHKIKPTFTYIGRNDVKDFIHTIETACKEEKGLNKMAESVNKLRVLMDQVYFQVEDAMAEIKAKYNI
ncbi:Hpt domain-containing protein [Pedobacter aquatilis]|uniref:Hpt domain-containing protein n=1 Tax=Pedobacter aquatilis TaxID=351343 RepID=UPI002930AE63|nr:Hpt domain-containing protein [Pedobacter aquatilis]